jgi:hypothetical protein
MQLLSPLNWSVREVVGDRAHPGEKHKPLDDLERLLVSDFFEHQLIR